MRDKMKGILIAGAAIAALATGGAAIAGAAGGDDDDDESDQPISGSALGKAKSAALESTGGGKVTETEAGDEEGAYEVEVTRGDGSQVDVHLDEQFEVIGSQADEEKAGDKDDGRD